MEIIKKLRLEKGLSAKQLGEKAGISWRYIYMIENDECNPSLKKLKAIAEVLGIEIKDLFKEEK